MKAICLAGKMNSGKSTVAQKLGKQLMEEGYIPLYLHLGVPIKLNAEMLSSEALALNVELASNYWNGFDRQDGGRIDEFLDYDRAMRNQKVQIPDQPEMTLGELMQGLGGAIHKTGHDFLITEAFGRLGNYLHRIAEGYKGVIDSYIPKHRERTWNMKEGAPDVVVVIDGVRYDEEINIIRGSKAFSRTTVLCPVRKVIGVDESRDDSHATETGLKYYVAGTQYVLECGSKDRQNIDDRDVREAVQELRIIWAELCE